MSAGIGVVTTVMFDTNDLDVSMDFWSEVLGLHVAHRDDTFAYMAQMSDGGPRLAFQLVNEGEEPFGFFCIVDHDRDRPMAP